MTSTVFVRICFRPLQNVPWCLSCSIKREEIGQFFCQRKDIVFLNSLILDFLGLKKMIFSLAQYLSENHVRPYELFLDLCHVRYYEKKHDIIFFPENFVFFQKLVFSTTSYLLQKWYCNFHSKCQNTCFTLTNSLLRFVKLDIANEKAKVFFVTGTIAFFENFVSNDFLSPIEKNL